MEENKEQFKVTHYKHLPEDSEGWLSLPMITRLKGNVDGPFYIDFEKSFPLSKEEIIAMERNGDFEKITPAADIKLSEVVWLSPEGEIWIADKHKPFGPLPKVLLAKVIPFRQRSLAK